MLYQIPKKKKKKTTQLFFLEDKSMYSVWRMRNKLNDSRGLSNISSPGPLLNSSSSYSDEDKLSLRAWAQLQVSTVNPLIYPAR